MPLRQILVLLKEKYQLSIDPERAAADYNRLLGEEFHHTIRMKPGALEFLQFMHHRQIPLALVTSAPQSIVESIFKHLQVDHYFDVIVTGDEVTHGKPHPDIYLKAVERLQIDTKKSCAVEDSLNGVLSAMRAGLATYHFEGNPGDIEGAIAVDNWKALQKLFEKVGNAHV